MRLWDVIEAADAMKPNAYGNEAKIAWLNEIEGQVQTEVLHVQPDAEDFLKYSYPQDQFAALIVEPPHDKLYTLYLCAMIDFNNGEYSKYQNSMLLFNNAWEEYAKWYIRNRHACAQGTFAGQTGGSSTGGGSGKDGKDGLSAYEIAVTHGYQGTESEWLDSLQGADGAQGQAGQDGKTPVKGVDYFTEADFADLPYAAKENTVITGSLSLGRKADSVVGDKSFAFGMDTEASEIGTFASGVNVSASGYWAHAEGINTKASGSGAHAEGSGTTASGENSHAEGVGTQAGTGAHAEGSHTTASGFGAHAEGVDTKASESNSHAEGLLTIASGYNAHAEGVDTKAAGHSAHAEGNGTLASGFFSHAEGAYTIAAGNIQHAQGKYNIADAADADGIYAHIVGNGTSENERSNAHTLDWNGNAWFAGDVFVGGAGQADGVKLVKTPAGTAGQILCLSETGTVEAIDMPVELPEGGITGQVLQKTDSGAAWGDAPSGMPEGGTAGQILTRTADGAVWEDPIPGPAGANGADGAPGPAGADGKSAYQIAADNGFEGTQAEWLASLKGDPGAPGGEVTKVEFDTLAASVSALQQSLGSIDTALDTLNGEVV